MANPLHPHIARSTTVALQAIAASDGWVALHLTLLVSILLVIGGLVGLARLLDDGPGGPLARLGIAAALLGGALAAVSTSMDGFVMKPLALAWATAPASAAAMALRLADAVRMIGFGVWSMGILVLFGLAFVCLGAAVAVSGRFLAWLGWTAVVSGAGSSVAAVLQIANTGEVQMAETLFFATSLLITVWTFAVGVLMWRTARESGKLRAAEPQPGH
ncbi:MAG: hypothetical protein ABI598_03915 [Chloroflexota bacterium]